MKNIVYIFFLAFFFSCKTDTPKVPATPIATPKKSEYLEENELKNYIPTASTVVPNKNAGAPFDTLDYDKIIAYDFKGSEEVTDAVINKYGNFIRVIRKQVSLNQTQADNITHLLTQKTSYGRETAACFMPHLGLVFYKNNKFIAQVNICLGCNYMESSIKIPAENKLHFGFMPKTRTKIRELCENLGFFVEKSELFDKQ